MNDFSSFVIIAEELSGNKTVEGSVVTLKYTGNVSFAPAQGVGAWNHWFGFKITAPTGVDVTKVIILRPDDVTRVMSNILDGDYYAYLYWGMTNEQDRITEYKIDWNGDGEYDLTVVLDATGATLLECQHAWDQGEETTEATCVQEGAMTYTCANCGATRTETIEKKPHTDVIDEGYAATCTTPGLTEGTHCSVCGEIRVAQNEIPVLEHVYDAGIVTTKPTCKVEGVMTYTCTRENCGYSYTDKIPVNENAHTLTHVEAQNPTCVDEGWNAYDYCEDCDYTTYVELPATGEHTYKNGKCEICEAPVFVPSIGGTNPGVNHDHSNEDGTVVTTFRAGTSADAPLVTITSPEGGWTLDADNDFTVSSAGDVACVVIVKNSADGKYYRIDATTAEDGTHTFTLDETFTENCELIVAVKGDADGNGIINNKDITLVKRLSNQTSWSDYELCVMNVAGNDSVIGNKEITLIKRAANGTDLGW